MQFHSCDTIGNEAENNHPHGTERDGYDNGLRMRKFSAHSMNAATS
jgi:hypothetical protein